MHKVICYYCGETFDRDAEPFVQVTARRYAHAKCSPKIEISQQERDYNNLIAYIKKLFNVQVVLPIVIKQIKEYHQNYGYSYSGIQKSLYWFYELKGNSVAKANNQLGIVPYIYSDACDYFYHLYLGEIASRETIEMPAPKKITIKSPTCTPEKIKREMFNLEVDIDE